MLRKVNNGHIIHAGPAYHICPGHISPTPLLGTRLLSVRLLDIPLLGKVNHGHVVHGCLAHNTRPGLLQRRETRGTRAHVVARLKQHLSPTTQTHQTQVLCYGGTRLVPATLHAVIFDDTHFGLLRLAVVAVAS